MTADIGLPSAEPQNPACGACQGETTLGDDDFECEDCGLCFNPDSLDASFTNPDAEVCGAPCDNWWHGDHRITPGWGYDCGSCKLPTGHPSNFHWTGCEPKRIAS